MILRCTLLLGFWQLVAGYAQANPPPVAHLIISRKAIDVLPNDISSLFQRKTEEWQRRIGEPAWDWHRDPKLKDRRLWHDVAVDLDTESQDQSSRIRSMQSFPRTAASAKRFYRKRGFYRGGLLPWAIEESYGALVEAFRSGDESQVIQAAGHLSYFAGNAANPFRVSANSKGQYTENLRFGDGRRLSPSAEHHSIRERFGIGLVIRHLSPIQSAMTVGRTDYDPILAPAIAAFAFFEDSLAALDEIARADRQILRDLEVVDRKSFEAKTELYYDELYRRCGDVCVARLEAGAVFCANLIGGAWQTAGQPTLETIRSRRPGSLTGAPLADLRQSPILGSRHSTVFHKNGCPFAKQIADDNLVTFNSALDARQAGRRGCKRCQP